LGRWGPQADKIRLLKPLTYESLWAIRAVTDWFKLPPQSVLVIYDDCRWEDSPTLIWFSWGHNGMKARSHTLAKFSPLANRHRQTPGAGASDDQLPSRAYYRAIFCSNPADVWYSNSWLSA